MSGPQSFLDGRVILHAGDCLEVVRALPDASVDAVVTDPPYALVSIGKRFGKKGAKAPASDGATGVYARAASGFMGKAWDTGERAFAAEFWEQILRVLKPGGHVAAFAGTRTYHRLACAIEDAGFEIRDQLAWVYGSGFPKSHDVSKGIDRHNGDAREKVKISADDLANPPNLVGGAVKGVDRPWRERALAAGYHEVDGPSAASAAWAGWGTALKPAWEPICLARKPLIGTVAENVLRDGTGAINVDGCRVETDDEIKPVFGGRKGEKNGSKFGHSGDYLSNVSPLGRWPANILHDGAIQGEAGRYFYTAKADADDRIGSLHPTVKPRDLMHWLCRLITPKGGTILDPFAGTGTTGESAWREGFSAILIEREEEYRADIARRMAFATEGQMARKVEIAKQRPRAGKGGDLPLFDEPALTGGGGGRRVYGEFADQKRLDSGAGHDADTGNSRHRGGQQLRGPGHGLEQAAPKPKRRVGPIGLKR